MIFQNSGDATKVLEEANMKKRLLIRILNSVGLLLSWKVFAIKMMLRPDSERTDGKCGIGL